NRHNRFARKQCGVVNHAIINAGRKGLSQFFQLGSNSVGGVNGVRSWKLEDHERRGRLAAELRRNRIIARGQLDSRDVADTRDLALRALFNNDLTELLFVEQTSLRADGQLKILAGGNGRL